MYMFPQNNSDKYIQVLSATNHWHLAPSPYLLTWSTTMTRQAQTTQVTSFGPQVCLSYPFFLFSLLMMYLLYRFTIGWHKQWWLALFGLGKFIFQSSVIFHFLYFSFLRFSPGATVITAPLLLHPPQDDNNQQRQLGPYQHCPPQQEDVITRESPRDFGPQ